MNEKENLIIVSRKPTHPGEVLREEYLPELGLSVSKLAEGLHVSRQSVYELIREKRAISPDMALRLGKFFGTTPRYWLNMQCNVDLWDSLDSSRDSIDNIIPFEVHEEGVSASEC